MLYPASLFTVMSLSHNGLRVWDRLYLGPEFSEDEIVSFLDMREIDHDRFDDEQLVEHVADLIADGNVVGWFRGRMEFGPRALGSRSILADATNPEMKTIINSKIKYREYFRPFAPVVCHDQVHNYFEVPPGTELPFMLKVPPVRPSKRNVIPAVTHEDGSGRVQTITEESNPVYYRLLKALECRTGVPIAVNTSFNVRGEPIVCSPEDAFNCFVNTGIDALVLGNCLLTVKPDVKLDISERHKHSDALEAQIGAERTARGTAEASVLNISASTTNATETTDKVLNFYKELPFNYYSNAVDTAVELLRSNRIKDYPVLHRHLRNLQGARVIDVGCGAGWFVNSCAHFYDASVVGLELNPVVLRQARSVAQLMPGCEKNQFIEANLFDYQADRPFDIVNSLGVLHHTPDCHEAIRRVLKWIAPGGFLHLGLYHLYGRSPFLKHFARLQADGASDSELYDEFRKLNPDISDETHLLSWFRDQVLHPHETQHTYEEVQSLLVDEGFVMNGARIRRLSGDFC